MVDYHYKTNNNIFVHSLQKAIGTFVSLCIFVVKTMFLNKNAQGLGRSKTQTAYSKHYPHFVYTAPVYDHLINNKQNVTSTVRFNILASANLR